MVAPDYLKNVHCICRRSFDHGWKIPGEGNGNCTFTVFLPWRPQIWSQNETDSDLSKVIPSLRICLDFGANFKAVLGAELFNSI